MKQKKQASRRERVSSVHILTSSPNVSTVWRRRLAQEWPEFRRGDAPGVPPLPTGGLAGTKEIKVHLD